MAGSVRNYAVLYFGAGRSRGGGVAVGGGNVLSSTPTHRLDGVEHVAADDTSRLDATVDRHGLLPKLSGDVADAFRGDGTFGGLDHGGLSGLGDDDHPQYTTDAEAATIAASVVSAYAQPLDSDLTAFAGLAIAADTLPYGTGSHTLGLTALTAAGRALIDDADATAQRVTLGLGTMAVESKTITTQDDLIVGGAAGILSRLPKGTDGQVLTVDPSTHHLVWATPTGGGSSLTVEEVDGSPTDSAVTKLVFPNGTLGIASHVATYTPASSGGLTHAYVGYNTIGGSTESVTNMRQYMKKITLASAGVLNSIGVYVKQTTAGNVISISAAILTDSGGSPSLLIAKNSGDGGDTLFLSTANGSAGAARWIDLAMGVYLAAGDYWIAVQLGSNSSPAGHQVYFDGSGTDRYFDNNTSSTRMSDSGWTTVTTSANKYSIRASTIT